MSILTPKHYKANWGFPWRPQAEAVASSLHPSCVLGLVLALFLSPAVGMKVSEQASLAQGTTQKAREGMGCDGGSAGSAHYTNAHRQPGAHYRLFKSWPNSISLFTSLRLSKPWPGGRPDHGAK